MDFDNYEVWSEAQRQDELLRMERIETVLRQMIDGILPNREEIRFLATECGLGDIFRKELT